ncbi:MAG: hypothetical protein ACQEUT_02140 [Bacillota bacterium]
MGTFGGGNSTARGLSLIKKVDSEESLGNESFSAVQNVTNKELILMFRTSQKYDYILRRNGKMIEQYSLTKRLKLHTYLSVKPLTLVQRARNFIHISASNH